MVEVVWSKRALKHLTKIDSRYRKVINEKTQQLVTFPLVTLDIKKLQDTDNQYRLRVGDYRVIFELIEGEPVVLRIEEVTRRTSRTY
ncbi:type II toxin-antitoxin system RelE/ParE family toxin [Pantoea sp. ACRSH]|uniref:type II toxin-antitoxin system RelE family toxin n=1 Tax=unclassified Pantoea TaxID=2630326 RepID=UPI001EF52757|nr:MULTISPECIES: type II toxin-antitoxin system RelE/ParE family toxin [unclassified Pantoea]MCG7368247.1 type II toxin-antitoxin system RelE/ParE family toxin [Pantoea sp. ACRSH]MCG7398656.1 type II toxin-antitoxin system RelE/ParE family toxin [Pantoea sp. ACRSC]